MQPDSVIDMGARYQPNRELLAQLPLTLVLDNFFYQHLREVYPKHIQTVDILFDGGNLDETQHWHTYTAATQKISSAIGAEEEAERYLRRVERQLKSYGEQIRQAKPEIDSYAVVQFADAKQLRIYARNSMFSVAFELMGLKQADLGIGNRWGNRLIKLYKLGELPENSCLLIIAPFHQMTQVELEQSYIWNRLGFGKTRCMRKLPAVWLFGGPDSISHFSYFLHKAMLETDK